MAGNRGLHRSRASWMSGGRGGRRRRCTALFTASRDDSLDKDGEGDAVNLLVRLDLAREASIAGEARRRARPPAARVRVGKRSREREESEWRKDLRGRDSAASRRLYPPRRTTERRGVRAGERREDDSGVVGHELLQDDDTFADNPLDSVSKYN